MKELRVSGGRIPLDNILHRFVVEAEELVLGEFCDGVLFAVGVEELDAGGEGCGELEDGADLAADEAVVRGVVEEGDQAEEFEVQGVVLVAKRPAQAGCGAGA